MEPCSMEDRLKNLERDSERNQGTHKEFFGKLEELKTQQAVVDVKFAQIMTSISEVQKDLKEIKEKPARRWENAVNIVLQWAILGLLAFITLKP